MQFQTDKAIYIQIAEYVMEKILTGTWELDGKIPSVRDLGGEIEVNPNTVMRAYDKLQQQNIIYNKRGLGFFVAANAISLITNERKQHFIENEIPQIFRTMELLQISIDDIVELYNKHTS
ncbi:GntR family transcriptional regulator [Sphingobacterium wenxiniae]|uniref:DNA-binding transcriptional regulator YhcF, GntR family n=1 Tax=Sphingobacterium wenxiniae TaxID=683125 RepID=A0A1I6TW27_9SPHI|nr:GntR family transcriptional regulator [Sphingobacterium wenxiniae]SFS93355.1 DNA-binding transcriptional regulator YhcF, GntR family [Sphingobacterium wenxiniae]